jgi:hypothetical protein
MARDTQSYLGIGGSWLSRFAGTTVEGKTIMLVHVAQTFDILKFPKRSAQFVDFFDQERWPNISAIYPTQCAPAFNHSKSV